MSATPISRRRMVFVTGTLRDMRAEREYLRAVVFPELQDRLRPRRHWLEPIDLRREVTADTAEDELAKELLALKVSLPEISRSSPLQIVLLGDRYGCIPPEVQAQAAVDEAGCEIDVAGKSVTALEAELAAIRERDHQQQCLFYFREALPYDRMPAEAASNFRDPTNARQLAELKQRIEVELPGCSRHYRVEWDDEKQSVSGLDEWGRMVLEDLWQILDEETRGWVGLPAVDWPDQQRWALEEFVQRTSRVFVGRTETCNRLLRLARSAADEGEIWGACVTGAAGTGKSSLFSHLHRRLESEDLLLLAHAAGIEASSCRVDTMLRRWTLELAESLGIDDPLGDAPSSRQIEACFVGLLSRASVNRRVVLLIDALDQFNPTPRAEHLEWLPNLWPENARLIATAIQGTAAESLERRFGVESVSLPPLGEQEAGEIAQAVSLRYNRRISPQVLEVLLSKRLAEGTPAAAIPLWLELAVEQLSLLDLDDLSLLDCPASGTQQEKLQQLVLYAAERLPPDVQSLCGWILKRSEDLLGAGWASVFANLISVSRYGLRESDLQVLLPKVTRLIAPTAPREVWDGLKFALQRRLFGVHLAPHGATGAWDFTHSQIREAVKRRNLRDTQLVQRIHTGVAYHLKSLASSDPLRQSEMMIHLIGSDDRLRAAHYFAAELPEDERKGATMALAAEILAGSNQAPNPGLAWAVSLPIEPRLDKAEVAAICRHYNTDLLEALKDNVQPGALVRLADATRKATEELLQHDPDNAQWQRELSASHDNAGDALLAQGRLSDSLACYRTSLGIRERLSSDMESLRDLAERHGRIGRLLVAQGDLPAALASCRASLEIRQRLAQETPGDVDLNRELSLGHEEIGDVLSGQGDFPAALAAYQASLELRQHLFEHDSDDARNRCGLSTAQEKIGGVLLSQGDLPGALAACRQSLVHREKQVEDHPHDPKSKHDLAAAHAMLGDILSQQGDLQSGQAAYRSSLEVQQRLRRQDPANVKCRRELLSCHEKLGEVLVKQGDLSGSLATYRASLEIGEDLRRQDPVNVVWQDSLSTNHLKVGDLLIAQNDFSGALTAYRSSFWIAEHLREQDPGNPRWQRDVVARYVRLAETHEKAGNHSEAGACWQSCHDRLSAMRDSGLPLEAPLTRLLEDLQRRL